MSLAICFKCGSTKSGALTICNDCGEVPRTGSDQVLSLVLSSQLSSQYDLGQYSRGLRSGRSPVVSPELLDQARYVLKDPQLVAMLSAQRGESDPPPSDPSVDSITASMPPSLSPQKALSTSLADEEPRNTKTVLHQSPFAILGVTTRDDRRRIVELAEEKALELDPEVCQKARSDLTSPRNRLSVELAWLPGVSPRKASELLDGLHHNPMAARAEAGVPTLALLNLLAAAFEAVDGGHDLDDLVEFIADIGYLVEELSAEEVWRDINEDRIVSRFPEVHALEQIEAGLAERKRYYRTAIRDALDRLPSTTLIQVMTEIVDSVTSHGAELAPGLIDDLVDSYEVEAQGFLQKEAENVSKLVRATRDHAESGEAAVKYYLDKLDAVARNWDKVAQPIQLSAKARGINHEASRDLGYEIRNLAIDLYNKHGLLNQSERLIGLIQELFAELPEIVDRTEEDAEALADISKERQRAANGGEEWARKITYRVEIGAMRKYTLSISPQGISWKGRNYPLNTITRIRWGGVRHSGMPTEATYTIAFGDRNSEAVVELKKLNIYSTFIDKIWRAVGVRLLTEMIGHLKDGYPIYFGGLLVQDHGVTLVKKKFFGSDEKMRCSWNEIYVWRENGAFCIAANDDRTVNVKFSYIDVENTHILEMAVRMAIKKQGLRRLSELLH